MFLALREFLSCRLEAGAPIGASRLAALEWWQAAREWIADRKPALWKSRKLTVAAAAVVGVVLAGLAYFGRVSVEAWCAIVVLAAVMSISTMAMRIAIWLVAAYLFNGPLAVVSGAKDVTHAFLFLLVGSTAVYLLMEWVRNLVRAEVSRGMKGAAAMGKEQVRQEAEQRVERVTAVAEEVVAEVQEQAVQSVAEVRQEGERMVAVVKDDFKAAMHMDVTAEAKKAVVLFRQGPQGDGDASDAFEKWCDALNKRLEVLVEECERVPELILAEGLERSLVVAVGAMLRRCVEGRVLVDYVVTGPEPVFDGDSARDFQKRQMVYGSIKLAVDNALIHGQAQRLQVVLSTAQGELLVVVVNDGVDLFEQHGIVGRDVLSPDEVMGWRNQSRGVADMKRLVRYGGDVCWRRSTGGTRVEIRMPVVSDVCV